jgi:hypothetical protein
MEETPMKRPTTPADAAPTTSAATAPLSEAQIVAMIRSDLAKQLKIADCQIQLVAARSRVWPDKGLGCAAQKGLYEPEQVPGYAITLGYGGVSYQYHADLSGRFVRCDAAGKPLGPIR